MDEVSPSHDASASARQPFSPGASASPMGWQPRQLAFKPYNSGSISQLGFSTPLPSSRSVNRRASVTKLSTDIVETYHACNPQFNYSEELNPKRYLTSPSVGVLNDGLDNANSDLILAVNYALINPRTHQRYVVKDILGHGTFGQVAKCWVSEGSSFCAVKIIKNQPAYYQQALVEVSILKMLNKKYDPEDKSHIVRIYDYFVYRQHLCICFELLDTNLYELIKLNHFQGLSLSIVQLFSKQILRGLALLKDAGVIHCDLKPENILLCTSMKPAEIKIIDFGSACMEDRTVYSYIQSRYYRSPEVLLGYRYTTAIDMWSFGCIVAELFLGLPLFPGASEFDLLQRMIKILGGQPPDYLLKEAKNASKFFKCVGNVHDLENMGASVGCKSIYHPLSEDEHEARESRKPSIGKEYFNHMNLEAIVLNYPYRKTLPREDMMKEGQIRLALIDFLRGLVEFDPEKRWSPFQASCHPFVTGEPFTCPYRPPPETPRVIVSQNVKVEHHPGGGHWFAAGLSPNVTNKSRISLHGSPNFQALPYGYGSSYGSLGSYGSYHDGMALSSSYGSYGDNSNIFAYYSPCGPSTMNINGPNGNVFGNSPDARRRVPSFSQGNSVGLSTPGNFAPLPLGTSPSQFTPPSSYSQFPVGSPGQFGPSSPARGSLQGSPLGKTGAMIPTNRRMGWGYSGSAQAQENASSFHWRGTSSDDMNCNPAEGNCSNSSDRLLHLPSACESFSSKQQGSRDRVVSGFSMVENLSGNFMPVNRQCPETLEGAGQSEASLSLPDPGDWDPSYSDEQLLQDDPADPSSVAIEFDKAMHFGTSQVSVVGTSQNSKARQRAPVQALSQSELGRGPSQDLQSGRIHSKSKPSISMAQHYNSLSRLGQQPAQRLSHGRNVYGRASEWNQHKVQSPASSFGGGGQHSAGSSSFFNTMAWGQRASDAFTSVRPTSRGRKESGGIS
ncbi:hypothetical protein MLD38_025607 [Melastoma candidum]|uniref:Uncharacterized protein n=1 Tax=Melastoma candidum TaxID=119954 RepID=A0ACB9NZ14_9MYRT|nr:hypothetical protein MLD38_025607 [Melastoma candidum]